MRKHLRCLTLFLLFLTFPMAVYADPPLYETNANVNLRAEPTTDSARLALIPVGTAVRVTDARDGEWFAVEADGQNGYMKAEFLTALEAAAPPAPPAPEPEPAEEPAAEPAVHTPEAVSEPAVPEPAPGTSLRAAFVTAANVNLRESPSTDSAKIVTVPRGRTLYVTDYRDGDWYYVDADGREGYMKAEFLTDAADAPAVQYAETSVGTVELTSWSEAKGAFKIGVPTQIIDTRTRATYWVKSFSNGKHADVEPVTPEDTATLRQTYNNRWSWDTRPILALIGGRVLAASINGMPHGGGINDQNNMDGQICIHFMDSRTHNGSRIHERDHQNAVREAFNTASGW